MIRSIAVDMERGWDQSAMIGFMRDGLEAKINAAVARYCDHESMGAPE